MNKKGCVILAAGRNSRLDTGKPKSLLKINDQTLLERHIDLFSRAGVTKFCVITGYQSEQVEVEVGRLNSLFEVGITPCFNERFDLENGYSVWMAKRWLKDHHLSAFFLTMADHVFDPAFVKRFVNMEAPSAATLHLAVDQPGPANAHIDIEDVTKVRSADGLILEIGKGITDYNFYDTGLFRMQSTIIKEFEACFQLGKYSISNTVQSLASKKEAGIIDMSGHVWNDVDNPDDYEKSKGLNLNQP